MLGRFQRFRWPKPNERVVGRCPDCGHVIADALEGGCPSCGLPFDPEEPARFADVEPDAAVAAGFDDPMQEDRE